MLHFFFQNNQLSYFSEVFARFPADPLNTDKVGNKRYVFIDQADIEYNNIVGMVKFGEITSTTVDEQCAESICRYTKAVRDEIAHLRAPSPGDVSDLIREMDRLSLNKSN